MGSHTTNYNLYKPDIDEQDWGEEVNTNFDTIDSQMNINAGANAHATTDGTSHSHVVLNDTHRTGDGSDHADVATNTTHSSGDGSDHANVATNTTHSSGDGSDHADVATNTTHSSGNGSDHADVASNTAARHTQNTDTNTTSDEWGIGDGTDTDKDIAAQNGDANEPKLRYDASSNKWQYSNDGTVFNDMGSGSAGATRGTFTNANLSSGVLTITHNAGLSSPYVMDVTVYDNNLKKILPDDMTGATNSVAVDLSSYGSISGTWGYCYIN